jgi:hydroxypyruvate reductase
MNLDIAHQTIRELFAAAIAAVDVRAAVQRAIRVEGGRLIIPEAEFEARFDDLGRIVVVAVGKAAAGMAAAAEEALDGRVASGLALTKYGSAASTRHIPVREAGHPTPDEAGMAAATELRDLCGGLTERDLVLCLISGGGSALLTAPVAPITLDDLRETTRLLLTAGANINELNTVRKHLETLKGGGLARAAAPARVVALAISDVLGDPLDVIASGPTVGDTSTFADAWEVIERRDLANRLPAPIAERLRAGKRDEIPDTPFPDDPCFAAVRTAVIANLPRAAEGAARRAAELGWYPIIGDLRIEGEAREAALRLIASAPIGSRRCLIGGGETTVTVRGDGIGGRNTELALAAALAIDGRAGLAVAALATDGDDGASNSAGAVVTGDTVARGHALGLDAADYLARNDSATYLRQVGGLLVTGPTQTNVADLYCVLKD